MNFLSPHNWWSTLKSAVFGSSSSLPPHVSEGGGLVCESVGKADLSDHFASKRSREAVDQRSLAIHLLFLPPLPSSRERSWRLLLDLDPYGGTDQLAMFRIFLKRTADVMAACLSVVFRRLVRLGSFPACWRQANVTRIPKCPPSSSVANYRPI